MANKVMLLLTGRTKPKGNVAGDKSLALYFDASERGWSLILTPQQRF